MTSLAKVDKVRRMPQRIEVLAHSNVLVPIGPTGGNKLVPQECRALVDDSDLPFKVELRVVVPLDGVTRPYASHVGVIARGTNRVTLEVMRKVRVGELVLAVLTEAAGLIENNGDGTYSMQPLPADRVSEFAAELDSAYGRSYNRVDDDLLQRVADAYRAGGEAPTRHVAETIGVTRSTAAKYVQRARKAGFLGAAVGRRAGEAK